MGTITIFTHALRPPLGAVPLTADCPLRVPLVPRQARGRLAEAPGQHQCTYIPLARTPSSDAKLTANEARKPYLFQGGLSVLLFVGGRRETLVSLAFCRGP